MSYVPRPWKPRSAETATGGRVRRALRGLLGGTGAPPVGGGATAIDRHIPRLTIALTLALFLAAATFVALRAAPAADAQNSFPGQGFLPHNRAWEKVSPSDKNGGDILIDSTRTQAAADGDAVVFASLAGFGDLQGMGAHAEYMAIRDAQPATNGWSTHGISPRQESGMITADYISGYQGDFSHDLSRGVFRSYLPLTDAPNVASVANLYLGDDLRTPGGASHTLLTDSVAPLPVGFQATRRPFRAAVSSDFDHVTFESRFNLTGETAGLAQPKLYESVQGAVRLVGVLPDGTPASSSVAGVDGASSLKYTPRTISADGSRVFFQANATPYVRINGRTTVQLNLSERAIPESPQDATVWSASEDGTRAFFITGEGLADGDDNGRADVYMWQLQPDDERQSLAIDATGGTFALSSRGSTTAPIPFDAQPSDVEAALEALASVGQGNVTVAGSPGAYAVTFTGDLAGTNLPQLIVDDSALSGGSMTATVATTNDVANLERVSIDQAGPDDTFALTVIGSSADGRFVYFTSQGELVDGQAPPIGPGIYLWHDGLVSYVGSLAFVADIAHNGPDTSSNFRASQMTSRVTPDGGHLLFMSHSDAGLQGVNGFPGYDHGSTCTFDNDGLPCRELYVYSADSGSLACASCNPTGAPATSDALAYFRYATGGAVTSLQRLNHHISDDGARVFFHTGEALVPEDRNGRLDAYVYDVATATPHLLSSGTSLSDSYFLDASADGDDAFIITRDRLSRWDVDDSYDLYNARVGGGLPEPANAAPACSGASCQGPSASPPADESSGSAAFQGAGNPPDCSSERRKAKRLKEKAKRLARKARGATGKKAKRLKKRAPKAKRKAKRARRDLRTCERGQS